MPIHPQYPDGAPGTPFMLQLGSGTSPETFTDVGRIGNLTGLDLSRADHKVTSHSRATNAAHKYVPGILEDGKMSFDLFLLPNSSQDDGLISLMVTGTERDWRVNHDDYGTIVDFVGYFDAFKMTFPVDGPVMAAAAIKATGPVYFFED